MESVDLSSIYPCCPRYMRGSYRVLTKMNPLLLRPFPDSAYKARNVGADGAMVNSPWYFSMMYHLMRERVELLESRAKLIDPLSRSRKRCLKKN